MAFSATLPLGHSSATLETWPAECLQLFTCGVLPAILIQRTSHESRDDQDRMEQEVQEILATVRELKGQQEQAK